MLEYKDIGNGKLKRHPTQQGEDIGIVLEFWESGQGRKYPVIMYSEAAQRFIIDNIDAVIATEIQKGKTSYHWGMNDEEAND